MARRRRRITLNKHGVKKAHTVVATIGGATVPASFIVLNPDSGARTVDGAAQNIKDNANTSETCFVGDIVKYINLHIQVGPRTGPSGNDTIGWLEWAFVCVKQTETAVPITQLGVLTLGTVCTNMFRNECIMSGFIPIGFQQANGQSISLKIPTTKSTVKIGDEWRFITYFRDMQAASTSTTAVRLIKSYNYKTYT